MSFKVQLSPSHHEFTVNAGETILDAAQRQDIGLPYGCQSGLCGSCHANIMDGGVAYPDEQPAALGKIPEGSCLTCMAVPTSDLVLSVHEGTASHIKPRILPVKVEKIEQLNHDVIRILLKAPENSPLEFAAGQYLDFLLQNGKRRAFSIANAPHDSAFIELHIRHVPGGSFTDFVFNEMKESAIMRIEAPLGTFIVNEESERPMIFIGGGTGYAPIKGQLEHLFHQDTGRNMALYVGVRSKRDLYMDDQPVQWAAAYANFSYTPVLSEPDADWDGRTGWVHEAVLADHADDLAVHDFYLAGPPIMVQAATEALRAAGVPDEQMYYDSFEYALDSKKK